MNGIVNDFLLSNQQAVHLGIALLLGAVIGIQRGWQARNRKAGERIAKSITIRVAATCHSFTYMVIMGRTS